MKLLIFLLASIVSIECKSFKDLPIYNAHVENRVDKVYRYPQKYLFSQKIVKLRSEKFDLPNVYLDGNLLLFDKTKLYYSLLSEYEVMKKIIPSDEKFYENVIDGRVSVSYTVENVNPDCPLNNVNDNMNNVNDNMNNVNDNMNDFIDNMNNVNDNMNDFIDNMNDFIDNADCTMTMVNTNSDAIYTPDKQTRFYINYGKQIVSLDIKLDSAALDFTLEDLDEKEIDHYRKTMKKESDLMWYRYVHGIDRSERGSAHLDSHLLEIIKSSNVIRNFHHSYDQFLITRELYEDLDESQD
jgi:hypothetical protein